MTKKQDIFWTTVAAVVILAVVAERIYHQVMYVH